jgi:hypothetical protein
MVCLGALPIDRAARADVFVVSQLGDIELSAGSDCPEDEPRPPDEAKLFTTDVSDLAEIG